MKEQIKELRVKIDGLSQLTKELKPIMNIHVRDGKKTNSKEIEKAYDNLILAKAWLGKVLEELGGVVNQGEDLVEEDTISYKLTEHIAINWFNNGVNTWKKREFEPKTHIEKVNWLRQTIESIISNIPTATVYNTTREWNIARTNTYNHLSEARFWLGFELQRIKESN